MPKHAVTTEYTLNTARLTQPLRLALVSDLHERRADDIVALLRRKRPDLILIAGDTFERYDDELRALRQGRKRVTRWLIAPAYLYNHAAMGILSRKNPPSPENATSFLSQAAKLAPVFLSLGNHEQKLLEEDFAFLKAHNITLLDNSGVEATVRGETLHIGGLSTTPDEAWLESFAQEDGFKLLLCHHPEYFETLVADKDIDLTLSGHNHGGQIRVFGKGVLSSRSGFFPKYDRGVFDNRLVVSAGCSNPVALPRWGNPRELVMIQLNPS